MIEHLLLTNSLQFLVLQIPFYFHNTMQFVQEPAIDACQLVYLIHCVVPMQCLQIKKNHDDRFCHIKSLS